VKPRPRLKHHRKVTSTRPRHLLHRLRPRLPRPSHRVLLYSNTPARIHELPLRYPTSVRCQRRSPHPHLLRSSRSTHRLHAPETPKSPPKPAAPKSWADLVRTKEAKTATAAAQAESTTVPNGVKSVPKSAPLAEALRQHTVTNDTLSFLEPRGLVNPGNMCYMNSVSSAMDYNVGMTLTNG
jgi:hypothetical protein